MRPLAPLLIVLIATVAACGRDTATTSGAPTNTAPTQTAPTKAAPTETARTMPATGDASARAAAQSIPDRPSPPREPEPPTSSAACSSKGVDREARRSATIHRWVDDAGITHYSDQAPTVPVSAHRVLEVAGAPPVTVEASGYDVNLPRDVQQRAIADALSVQRVFRDTLGVAMPSAIVLRVVFVRDEAAYGRLIGDSALATSSGAYVPPQRTIYVRMQGDDELAFSVLRHEITHALIHEAVGNLPVALGEGLAEYFRRYRIAGMGGGIDLGADRASLAAAAPAGDGGDALVELLALSGSDFYAADRERRYLEAYALVAVLMQGAAPIAALHDVLARQRAEPCRPIAAESVLEARYPGGLRALAGDWAAFMRNVPATVRTY